MFVSSVRVIDVAKVETSLATLKEPIEPPEPKAAVIAVPVVAKVVDEDVNAESIGAFVGGTAPLKVTIFDPEGASNTVVNEPEEPFDDTVIVGLPTLAPV